MNLSQLPYIVAIAGTGSLLAASRELGISQSTLSHYLSKLEGELGMDLFFRTKKKMYLTQAGQKYVRTARQILELMEGTHKAIAQLDRPAVQALRVGLSPHSGARILAQVYTTFNHRFPSVQLLPREGYAEDLKDMLRRGEIDLCLTSGEETEGLTWYPMGCSEIVLAIPTALHATLPDPENAVLKDLSAFHNSVFVLPSKPSALYDAVSAILKEAGFQPKVFFNTPNVLMLRQMISSGAGIGFLPLYNAAPDPSLRIFHLQPSRQFFTCAYTRTGYRLTEPERYLLFLFLQHNAETNELVLTEFNRGLIWEYAPETAIALDWEEPT